MSQVWEPGSMGSSPNPASKFSYVLWWNVFSGLSLFIIKMVELCKKTSKGFPCRGYSSVVYPWVPEPKVVAPKTWVSSLWAASDKLQRKNNLSSRTWHRMSILPGASWILTSSCDPRELVKWQIVTSLSYVVRALLTNCIIFLKPFSTQSFKQTLLID